MNKTIKSTLQFIIFLGLGLFLVYYAFSGLTSNEIEKVKQAFINANYWWIALGLLISGISHLIRAYRWRMLLQPMNHNPKISTSFYAVMIGYLANLAFPRLGEISRCTVLLKYEKIPFTTSFGTVVTERIIDTLTWFLLLVLTILFQFSTLIDFLRDSIIKPLENKFYSLFNNALFWVFIIVILLSAIFVIAYYRKKILNSNLFQKVSKILNGFLEGLLSIKKLEKPWLFLFLSISIWFCYILVTYVSTFCMPQISHAGFGASVSIIAFATFAIVATQGGIGAYPLLVMQVLLLYNIDKVSGLAFGWIIWSAQALQSILFGIVSMLLLPLSAKD